jgi:hypothetical protein
MCKKVQSKPYFSIKPHTFVKRIEDISNLARANNDRAERGKLVLCVLECDDCSSFCIVEVWSCAEQLFLSPLQRERCCYAANNRALS